jgi:hypothetical protein
MMAVTKNIKCCENLGESAAETMAMIRQAFGERKHEPYTESPNSLRPKKARWGKSKIRSMLFIFFDIKGNVHKEFILAGQTVNSTYCWDFLWQLCENVLRFHLELWR